MTLQGFGTLLVDVANCVSVFGITQMKRISFITTYSFLALLEIKRLNPFDFLLQFELKALGLNLTHTHLVIFDY
jgi:hypothetical protein